MASMGRATGHGPGAALSGGACPVSPAAVVAPAASTSGAPENAAPASGPAAVALVLLAQGGDRAAFGRLFERYAPMVHGVLLARVPRAEADDLMQDVFVSALTRLTGLREPAAFGGWLAMIARNRVIDWRRARRETTELPDDLSRPEPDRSEAEQVLAVIRTLPEAYREPLVLRLVEGLTGPEIAEQVGLTPDSVRVNLHRGMKQLRERLGWTS
jgi:RNA polymerase sigma-70 factor, ECF subfamily